MPRLRANILDESIYDEVDYHFMSDVPYRLDNPTLASMQKLERGLHYVLRNLMKLDMTMEEVAQHAGYSPGYFRNLFSAHFEMPFERFVTKLRMRQAAREIRDLHFPKGLVERYGFANTAGFSKAFRREIGVSPRNFYKGNYAVPDMPLRHRLNGVELTLEYTIGRAFSLTGLVAQPPHGDQTFLMDALALPFTDGFASAKAQFKNAESQEYVGIWYYLPERGLEYVFGPVKEHFDAITVSDQASEDENGHLSIIVQGGRYAVFSYPRPEDDRDIPLMQRALSRYIFQEWIPINRKVTSAMGYTYERFTADRIYFYLPMKGGMGNTSELQELTWGVADWAHHIDDLLTLDLNADVLADLEGYSPRNYADVFSMYYGITPAAYIRRRRLYLAGEELSGDANEESGEGPSAERLEEHREKIARKYRFASYEQLLRMREKEFGNSSSQTDEANVGEQVGASGELADLRAYYETNKERVAFEIRRLQEFQILGHSIEKSRDGRRLYDLTGLVLYWFGRMFPGFDGFVPYFATDGAKVFIWADEEAEESGTEQTDEAARYYVAHILRDDLTSEEQAAVETGCESAGAHLEAIPGGCYAVFSTVDDLESYSLDDAFSLLTRCAFGGWIKENRWRVDFSRRTFVAWSDRRFYFFVPTVG